MGRSRGNFHSGDDDPTQRSRRKKNASSGENLESSGAGRLFSYMMVLVKELLKGKGLYTTAIIATKTLRENPIKCVMCPDFDLCIDCFSVGAEVTPHKNNHPYRVMDNLSFPLICPDWNADDEILLLEDMTHVVGKNRKELLAMAKGHSEDKKGFSSLGELNLKEESSFSPSRIKLEDMHKGGPSSSLLSSLNTDAEPGVRSSGANSAATAANKKPSKMTQVKDSPTIVKVEGMMLKQTGVSRGKPNLGNDGSLVELSGYNPKRQEFDPEYDNDAEQLLADMEFKDNDTEEEREIKLRVLRIYSKR
ncbi:hypothetical protein FNV43_RR07304 [Rhamnella rubrinervis]|uniref:ZZ-type domain-containing protein n=1 Tax=Rhamnella rubrinervis TaxID=2594499 RepID=A0A8K0HF11_9ROSA|nr:hypothetical protein FNV43_RR07304 [Rhamnella rubrinervis]